MYFEDFIIGKQTLTSERKITAPDLDAFLKIFGLNLPMFTSDQGARNMGHKQRLVPGPMIIPLAMGLVVKAGWFDHVVALVGLDDLIFERALYPQDSVKVDISVKQAKSTKNPKRGLVALDFRVINQNDEAVLSGRGKYLIQTRPKGNASK